MAIKLFCNKCHGFIREITPQDASSLSGNEICVNCEETGRGYIDQLGKLHKKLSLELDATYNKAIVQLETLIRDTFE